MFGPYFGCCGRCRFVAVAMRLNRWCGIVTQMGMDINNAGRHKFAGTINDCCTLRNSGICSPNAANLAIGEKDYPIFDTPTFAIKDSDVADCRRNTGIRLIGRRVRVLINCTRLFRRHSRGALRRLADVGTGGQRQRSDQKRPMQFALHMLMLPFLLQCLRP